jgi:hypothetical protein
MWGNPFIIGKDGDREEVIDKYLSWIVLPEQLHIRRHLHDLKGKVLGCWCAPKACHGDVLLQLVEEL